MFLIVVLKKIHIKKCFIAAMEGRLRLFYFLQNTILTYKIKVI